MAIDTIKGEVVRLIDTESEPRQRQLDDLSAQVQDLLRSLFVAIGEPGRRIKDLLHGTWLGHPLHSALTDVPVGAWTVGMLLDLIGAKKSADRAITIGVLSAIPTALAGAADWGETEGKSRRVGLMHAILNSVALTGFITSLVMRRSGLRAIGVLLSTASYAIAATSAWLGGEIVYALGTNVNRNAFKPENGTDHFKVAARADDIADGRLSRAVVEIEGQTIPLVVYRRGPEVMVLDGTCSHWGGPLWEGTVVIEDDGAPCVECPWHGSTFDLRDGHVVHGPATVSEPRYEARLRAGNLEVKKVA